MKLLASGSVWALLGAIAALVSSPVVLNLVPPDVAIYISAGAAALAAFSKSITDHLKPPE